MLAHREDYDKNGFVCFNTDGCMLNIPVSGMSLDNYCWVGLTN